MRNRPLTGEEPSGGSGEGGVVEKVPVRRPASPRTDRRDDGAQHMVFGRSAASDLRLQVGYEQSQFIGRGIRLMEE